MKKDIFIIALIIIICCLCLDMYNHPKNVEKSENSTTNEQNTKIEDSSSQFKLKIGSYTLNEINFDELGYYYSSCGLTIKENNEFDFSVGEGFWYTGNYEEVNNKIICKASKFMGESGGSVTNDDVNIKFHFQLISNSTLELIRLEMQDTKHTKELSEVFEVGTTYSNSNSLIPYEIKKTDENKVEISTSQLDKNGNIISREFETAAQIGKTGVTMIPKIGIVALVEDSGGEYCGVTIYRLVDDKIVKIGSISFGADAIGKPTYEVTKNGNNSAIIKATENDNSIEEEIKTDSNMTNADVIKILDNGDVVAISESNENNHIVKFYRLSGDYTTGEVDKIIEVGSIKY